MKPLDGVNADGFFSRLPAKGWCQFGVCVCVCGFFFFFFGRLID